MDKLTFNKIVLNETHDRIIFRVMTIHVKVCDIRRKDLKRSQLTLSYYSKFSSYRNT